MAKKKFFKKDKPLPKPEELEKNGAFVENKEEQMSPEEALEYQKQRQELLKNSFGKSRFADITHRAEGKRVGVNGEIITKQKSYFNEDYLEQRIVEIIKREIPKLLIEYLEENK